MIKVASLGELAHTYVLLIQRSFNQNCFALSALTAPASGPSRAAMIPVTSWSRAAVTIRWWQSRDLVYDYTTIYSSSFCQTTSSASCGADSGGHCRPADAILLYDLLRPGQTRTWTCTA